MNDSLLLAMQSAFWVTLFIGFFVWTVLGYFVGQTKGRSSQGAWLGFLLGVIGVFAVGMMEPTDEELRRRQRLFAPQGSPTGLPAGDLSRTELVADALRRDPTLGDVSDPAAPARLQAALAVATAELQFRADIDAAHAHEATKAAELAELERARADQQAQAVREHEQTLLVAAQAEAQRAAREAKLASRGPFPRWLATHPLVTVTAGVAILALVVAGLSMVSRPNVVVTRGGPVPSGPASAFDFSGSYTVTTSITKSTQADQAVGNAKSFTWVVTTKCSGATCTTTAVGDGVTNFLTAAGSGFHAERTWQGNCVSNKPLSGQADWTTVTDLVVARVDQDKVKSLTGTSRSTQLTLCPGQSGALGEITSTVKIDSI